MYGLEIPSLIRFFVQLNLVIAGASSLWCFAFALKARRAKTKEEGDNWIRLAHNLGYVFVGAVFLFIVSWWVSALFIFPGDTIAHEGFVHGASFPEEFINKGYQANLIWVSVLVGFNFVAALLYRKKKRSFEFFKKEAMFYFGTNTALLSIILILSSFTGEFSKLQTALSFHNWHSIITLGTVICVDILFLLTIKKDNLKRILYPFYPVMSAAIWFGLGLDFISSFLILDNGFPGTEQFLFNQVVVVILILNGALLSVGINDAIIGLIKPDRVDTFDPTLDEVVRISGSISIVSWMTITFIDFFVLPMSLLQLTSIYLVLIFIAYIGKPIAERQFDRFMVQG